LRFPDRPLALRQPVYKLNPTKAGRADMGRLRSTVKNGQKIIADTQAPHKRRTKSGVLLQTL